MSGLCAPAGRGRLGSVWPGDRGCRWSRSSDRWRLRAQGSRWRLRFP